MANTTQRRRLIAGNWKMFKTRLESQNFLQGVLTNWLPAFDTVDAWLCPSFTLLGGMQRIIQNQGLSLKLAAQTMESHLDGAYTGEVSALQLLDLNVGGVVLGHSERRQYFNETNEGVNAKTIQALNNGLLPIVCVGETLAQREAGETDAVVVEQTLAAFKGINEQQATEVVVAYEPVWAIGTGKVCEADEAGRVCGVIRNTLASAYSQASADKVRILYGGSMKPDNAEQLLAQADIDGGLVGGASLEADSYLKLLAIASA